VPEVDQRAVWEEKMTASGGPAAIRGFRLQTSYILLRLLRAEPTEQFRPEGQEDLDVLGPDGRATEHVQVKAYGDALQFAQLAAADSSGPHAEPPYFRRALTRLQATGTRETVASFGPVGPELLGAWRNADLDDARHRRSVTRKLEALAYTPAEVAALFAGVTFVEVSEDDQRRSALSLLQGGLSAGDMPWALNALSYWLLTQSEARATVRIADVHAQLHEISRHLAEQGAHVRTWGSALRPLIPDDLVARDVAVLRQELYEGVGARPEHILAEVDVRRPELLGRLDAAFAAARVVVVRGASGQGKSAAAYRYLHESAPAAFTFEVGRLQDVSHAREVGLAVMGRMRAMRVPMWLLIDVRPGDALWLELLSDLSRTEQLRVLVTVREEDWTRARDALELIPHQEVELTFGADDAEPVFGALALQRPSGQFLSFTEAWRYFEERGPLLEFVYLVTHDGQRLRARLSGQVNALVARWEQTPEKLDFLHAAVLAAASGARVRTLDLARACGLPARAASTTVRTLEREHLLRLEEPPAAAEQVAAPGALPGGGLIGGLHAVRSMFLLELLSGPEVPASGAFARALQAVVDEDLELLTLHALLTLPADQVLPALHAANPPSWTGRAGLTRALMWHGVRVHAEQYRPVVTEAHRLFGSNWWMFLPHDLFGLLPLGLMPDVGDWSTFTFVSGPMRRKLARLRAQSPGEAAAFVDARRWLAEHPNPPASPVTSGDWAGLAELAFYAGLWNLPAQGFLPGNQGEWRAAARLPLDEASEVHYGLSFLRPPEPAEVSELNEVSEAGLNWTDLDAARRELQAALVTRFMEEAPILHLEDDGERITLWFPFPAGADPLASGTRVEADSQMDVLSRRLQLALQLFPDRLRFASHGYGHRMALLPMPGGHDDSVKDMPRENLPPLWAVRWNAAFHRLAEREFLLEDWTAHAEHQRHRRENVLSPLEGMLEALPLVRAGARKHTDNDSWRLQVALQAVLGAASPAEEHQELPRSAVDPWGLSSAPRAAERQVAAAAARLTRQYDARHHDAYLRALRKYMHALSTFFRQAGEGLWAVALLARPQERNAAARQRRQLEPALHGLFLSLVNLGDVLEQLPLMQAEYRARFGARLDPADLAALEARERQALEAVWAVWAEVSRVPDLVGAAGAAPARRPGGSAVWAEDVEARALRRLAYELEPLRAQGVLVRTLDSDERWDAQGPSLWLTMELRSAETLYDSVPLVMGALHRTLQHAAASRERHQVMQHAWHTIVVVPTRAGRPWRPAVWVTNPLALSEPLSTTQWWRLPPQGAEPALLERLGLPLWPFDAPPELTQVQEVLGEHFVLTSRLADLARLGDVPGITQDRLEQFLSEEDDRVREAEARLSALVAAGALNGLLGDAPAAEVEQAVPVGQVDTTLPLPEGEEEQGATSGELPVVPSLDGLGEVPPENRAAFETLMLLSLVEQARLQQDEQTLGPLMADQYTVDAEVVWPPNRVD